MGNTSSTGPFSIAILVYQRVIGGGFKVFLIFTRPGEIFEPFLKLPFSLEKPPVFFRFPVFTGDFQHLFDPTYSFG